MVRLLLLSASVLAMSGFLPSFHIKAATCCTGKRTGKRTQFVSRAMPVSRDSHGHHSIPVTRYELLLVSQHLQIRRRRSSRRLQAIWIIDSDSIFRLHCAHYAGHFWDVAPLGAICGSTQGSSGEITSTDLPTSAARISSRVIRKLLAGCVLEQVTQGDGIVNTMAYTS